MWGIIDIDVLVTLLELFPVLTLFLAANTAKKILNLSKGEIVPIIVIATAVVPLRHNLGQLQDSRY